MTSRPATPIRMGSLDDALKYAEFLESERDRLTTALLLAQTEIKGHKEELAMAQRALSSAIHIGSEVQSRIAELEKDAARIDWVERYLCRAGEVKNDAGQTVKLARVWSIMGELETFRETVDAHIAALKSRA